MQRLEHDDDLAELAIVLEITMDLDHLVEPKVRSMTGFKALLSRPLSTNLIAAFRRTGSPVVRAD